eukprot:PITA_07184
MGRENVINSTPSSFLPFVASTTSSMPYGSQREPTLPDVDPTQKTLEKAWKPLERNEVDDAVYDFFIGCNISFNTIRSSLFHDMLKKIGHFGPSYVLPSYESLRTKGIDRSKQRIEERVKPIRDSWAISGCTLVSDGWTDRQSRPLMNTLDCCPEGVIHLSTINCMDKTKIAEYLFQILKDTILSIGEDNVVQVVTDNASNCVRAGELLMEHFPKLFWTPCVAHCIDLALHDIGKIGWVQVNISQARQLVKFILNHRLSLSIFRKYKTRNLLRPGDTRFATHFISLQRVVEQKAALRSFVCNEEWVKSPLSRSEDGKLIEKTIFNEMFWSCAEKIISICEPIVQILRMVDSNAACMGFVYEGMDRVREHISLVCKNDSSIYNPIWRIVEKRWCMLHTPLHAAGLFHAPNYFHVPKDRDIMEGFYNCMERMCHDPEIQYKIRIQSISYRQGTGHAFTTARALRDMHHPEVTPAQWWFLHGYETPQLQTFVVRVLSQVTSASACERSWSTHEFIHSKKRNHLGASKLADLASIHCNLHLWLKSLEGKKTTSNIVREVPPIFNASSATSQAPIVGSSTVSTHHINENDVLLRDIIDESASSDNDSLMSEYTDVDEDNADEMTYTP